MSFVSPNDELEIDFQNKSTINLTNKKQMKVEELPPFMQEMIRAGGLVEYARRKISKVSAKKITGHKGENR